MPDFFFKSLSVKLLTTGGDLLAARDVRVKTRVIVVARCGVE